jgi:large subunit ribosomal protein L1
VAKRGKKYLDAAKQFSRESTYSSQEAVELVKATSTADFDATVEVHMRLALDPRQADEQLRGVVSLPHGTGKQVRILVFAEGEATKMAEEAGADHVADDDLIKKIEKGWLEFDATIAIPQMMGKVSKLGRILGPRGLMPSPKSGTVVAPEDVGRVIDELRQGRVEFKMDKTANIHVPIGKVGFQPEQLLDNFAHLMDAIQSSRPPGAKGQYIKKIVLTSTMGPGIKVDIADAMALRAA